MSEIQDPGETRPEPIVDVEFEDSGVDPGLSKIRAIAWLVGFSLIMAATIAGLTWWANDAPDPLDNDANAWPGITIRQFESAEIIVDLDSFGSQTQFLIEQERAAVDLAALQPEPLGPVASLDDGRRWFLGWGRFLLVVPFVLLILANERRIRAGSGQQTSD